MFGFLKCLSQREAHVKHVLSVSLEPKVTYSSQGVITNNYEQGNTAKNRQK